MKAIHLHLPRLPAQRVIDITPMPWWRRTARAASALLICALTLALLGLLGGLLALALLSGTAAMLVRGLVHARRMKRAARRSAHASRPSSPDPTS